MSEPYRHFLRKGIERIGRNVSTNALQKAAVDFNTESNKAQYSYNFSWMGRPIIQYPRT
jgi:cephalosporin hydroxylase